MEKIKSINQNSQVLYEINKSKFYGFSFKIDKINEINEILLNIKKAHKTATHICYAYILNSNEKCSDNGEPSGTAGKPILEVIKKKELINVLVIVVRYFGGIKLGAGGLSRAYGQTASMVLNESGDCFYELYNQYNIQINYGNDEKLIVNFLEQNENVVLLNKQYNENIVIDFAITMKQTELIKNQIVNMLKGNANLHFNNTVILRSSCGNNN